MGERAPGPGSGGGGHGFAGRPADHFAQRYAERMVLAHDASCFIDWFDPEAKRQVVPRWNYRHISEDVLPALRERGVTDAQITSMLVDVPRRYFE